MYTKPCIELVFNKNGILVDAWAIHDDEEQTRAIQLQVSDSEEHIKVAAPSITALNFHSFRIKRTQLEK